MTSGRSAVGLEEPEPDLADGRIGRHGVPEPVDGDLVDDRDGRRMQELGDVLSDTGMAGTLGTKPAPARCPSRSRCAICRPDLARPREAAVAADQVDAGGL